jgi:hypothetical protein
VEVFYLTISEGFGTEAKIPRRTVSCDILRMLELEARKRKEIDGKCKEEDLLRILE